jgi:hypothetical protein
MISKNALDLTGRVFGRLTVLCPSSGRYSRSGQAKTRWKCKCSCGLEVRVDTAHLRRGTTKSCGCLNLEQTIQRSTSHGMRNSPTYNSWASMKRRCGRGRYRGITFCDRWGDFKNFLEDMGERPEGKTLDRYPNREGNYEPGNCRWATPKEQANNRKPRQPHRKPR